MATPQRIIINIRDASGEREASEARQTIARWLVGLTILMVLFCGMFPFDFAFSFRTASGEISRRFDLTIDQLWTAGDGLENVVFFLPVGFAFGALLWSGRRGQFGKGFAWNKQLRRIALRCVLAIGCCCALSAIVELSQVYLISRDPSLADICSNTTGGVFGFTLFIAVGEPVMQWLVRRLMAIRRIRDSRIFGAAACVWFLIAVAAPILARHRSSLDQWDPSYPLLLGNETSGQRHWDGTISNVWLADTAVGDESIETMLTMTDPVQSLRDSMVMSYHLTGHGPYADRTGHTGALSWAGSVTPATTEPADLTGVDAIGRIGVPISAAWWLRTAPGDAAQATGRICHADAFTLVLDVEVANLNQGDGWPRIFSMSKDTTHCNLQLIQNQTSLELRIRTAASGELGDNPELIIPDVFLEARPQRVIVTFDHGRVTVASDQNGERYSVQYSPDAWLVWQIYPRTGWPYRLDSSGQVVASAMYRGLAMLPIGIFVGAMLRITRQGKWVPLLFVGNVCATALALELLLHFAAGVPFSISAPIVSLLAACAGASLVLRRLPLSAKPL